MRKPAQDPSLLEEFDSNMSIASEDSDDLILDQQTVQNMIKKLQRSPIRDSDSPFPNQVNTPCGRFKQQDNVCIYTAHETFDTSYSRKQDKIDSGLKSFCKNLYFEYQKVVKERDELRVINQRQNHDILNYKRSLKNVQQQLTALLRVEVPRIGKENFSHNICFHESIFKEKNELEQKFTFYHKKVGEYIVKVDHQDTLIEELKSRIQRLLQGKGIPMNDPLCHDYGNSKILDELDRPDNLILPRESRFIEKNDNPLFDDCHRASKLSSYGKLFDDHSSIENLVLDIDLVNHSKDLNLSLKDKRVIGRSIICKKSHR